MVLAIKPVLSRRESPRFIANNTRMPPCGFLLKSPAGDAVKTRKGRRQTPPPFRIFLLAPAQLGDQGAVALDVLLLQISQQVTALADHLQQTAVAVLVVFIGLQVLIQVVDARGEQRDLNLGGTRVRLVYARRKR